jgi:hypothetical protein
VKKSQQDGLLTPFTEFSPGKDLFEKHRQKGARRWILTHLFHSSNKIFIIIVLFTTIFASVLASTISVLLGTAVEEFLSVLLHFNFNLAKLVSSNTEKLM